MYIHMQAYIYILAVGRQHVQVLQYGFHFLIVATMQTQDKGNEN